MLNNPFVLSMIDSTNGLYPETKIKLFRPPKYFKRDPDGQKLYLIDYLNVF